MEININDNNFEEEVIKNDGVTLVDFWAPWCGPCKMMGPIVEELAGEFEDKIKIRKLNVDENPVSASKYEILSIPAFKFFKDGEVVGEMVGLKSKEAMIEEINNIIKD